MEKWAKGLNQRREYFREPEVPAKSSKADDTNTEEAVTAIVEAQISIASFLLLIG